MPRVAAGLSRWPFKPKYRVQLPDGVLCCVLECPIWPLRCDDIGVKRLEPFTRLMPHSSNGEDIALSRQRYGFKSRMRYLVCNHINIRTLTRISHFNYHRHETRRMDDHASMYSWCYKRKTRRRVSNDMWLSGKRYIRKRSKV